MESITRFIMQRLKLKVNEAKRAVARPQERKFLGFSFSFGAEPKRVIAPKALDRFKRRIREITRRAKGVSLEATVEELARYLVGWRNYFGFCETPEVLNSLTRWVRRRLRSALWGSGARHADARRPCSRSGWVRCWQVIRLPAPMVPGPRVRTRPCTLACRTPTSVRSNFRPWPRRASVTARTAV
jgi:Group II intron, maturase-specific domain